MNITIFCSSKDVGGDFATHAQEFAMKLAERKHNLVFGASNTGLMKVISETAHHHGATVTGVTIAAFEKVTRPNLDKLIVARSLVERKDELLDRGDAIAMLVGGTGTLDEITDMIELKKIGVHQKPMVIVNFNNYYQGLLEQLQCMKAQGFLEWELSELVYFAKTADEALDYLEEKAQTKLPD